MSLDTAINGVVAVRLQVEVAETLIEGRRDRDNLLLRRRAQQQALIECHEDLTETGWIGRTGPDYYWAAPIATPLQSSNQHAGIVGCTHYHG